jgi:hypothetical protein
MTTLTEAKAQRITPRYRGIAAGHVPSVTGASQYGCLDRPAPGWFSSG